jgi:DNA-binding LytR/AlgR family response regulator
MKVAICDDNEQELFRIRQFVDEYLRFDFSRISMEVSTFNSSATLISHLENGNFFDIFLLDVIMPDTNGIELATKIRNHDHAAKIIFLTSSSEFALESYSVSAFNYLVKPIQKDKFFSILEKACIDINCSQTQYILVKNQSRISKIFLHELTYVEVIGRIVYFHQIGRLKLESISRITQAESDLLIHKRFIKPHRSYIVNLDFVKTLSQNGFTLTNSTFIPISRNVYKNIKEAYINYSFANIK